MREPATDSLAVLLLPGKLEGIALEAHARDLLSIPRVIALEPSRFRPPRYLRDSISLRQARRLRFPGQPRLLLLYHAAQYPLARALCARYEDLELWYVSPGRQDRPGRARCTTAPGPRSGRTAPGRAGTAPGGTGAAAAAA